MDEKWGGEDEGEEEEDSLCMGEKKISEVGAALVHL